MKQAYDDIRCYQECDYQNAQSQLWNDPEFLHLLRKIPFIPNADAYRQLALSFPTLESFQKGFVRPLLKEVCQMSHSQITCSGLENIDKSKAYLFISNHRDIVMDTVQLNHILFENGFEPSETAIGNNLLIRPWIEHFVRLLKCFIVKRGVGVKEQILASRELSSYIQDAIKQRGQCIWMAQREGRAKDSNDRTQKSVLKMLILSGGSNVLEELASLCPLPLSLSYEYDPCDYLKAKEMQMKRDIEGFKKSPADDLLNMLTGITGYKGRVHYHIDQCLSQEILQMDASMPKNDLLQLIADRIDTSIHRHYRMYPNNYVAADLLSGSKDFADKYSNEDLLRFETYLNKQIEKIDIPQEQKDEAFLREKILEMYANPLKNHLNTL